MIRSTAICGLIACIVLLLVCADCTAAESPADRLYGVAAQCIREHKLDRADLTLRLALKADEDHHKAYDLLWALHRKRGLVATPRQVNQLAREFPDGSYLRQTPYYLIIYDAAHPWADTRARMLEAARVNFFKTLKRDGFRPLPPRNKLVCVLFNQHEDFHTYAQRVDHLNRSWSGGYYSSRTNRVAMFNYHTSPQLRDLVIQMRKLEAQVQRAVGAAATSPRAAGALGAVQRELAQVKRRYETIASYGNIRQTLHEAAHQLAYNTGIQRPGVAYPMWFAEGLATCFEATNPAVPFGPTFGNVSRSYDLREARRQSKLEPLDQFVRRATAPELEDHVATAYAQSWALFHFLYNHRLSQLRAYVRDMKRQPVSPPSEDQLHTDFVKHFGEPADLQAAFDAYVRKLEP